LAGEARARAARRRKIIVLSCDIAGWWEWESWVGENVWCLLQGGVGWVL
jgi:hypothetical protein